MSAQITAKKWIASVLVAWLCSVSTANAITFNQDQIPDTKAWNSIDYVFDASLDGGNGGYHMDIDGIVVGSDYNIGAAVYPAGDCNFGGLMLACYTLDADFDLNGNLLSGGVIDIVYNGAYDYSLDGINILSAVANGDADGHDTAQLGNGPYGYIVHGELTSFGFQDNDPGSDDIGLFAFGFTISSQDGGDYFDIWGGTTGGTIIDTRQLLDANLDAYTLEAGGTSWADIDGAGKTIMETEFHALLNGQTTSDTFIPIPPAIWLFGSGLALLGGMARKRKGTV